MPSELSFSKAANAELNIVELRKPMAEVNFEMPISKAGYDDKQFLKMMVTSLGPPCFVRFFEKNHILRYHKSYTLQ